MLQARILPGPRRRWTRRRLQAADVVGRVHGDGQPCQRAGGESGPRPRRDVAAGRPEEALDHRRRGRAGGPGGGALPEARAPAWSGRGRCLPWAGSTRRGTWPSRRGWSRRVDQKLPYEEAAALACAASCRSRMRRAHRICRGPLTTPPRRHGCLTALGARVSLGTPAAGSVSPAHAGCRRGRRSARLVLRRVVLGGASRRDRAASAAPHAGELDGVRSSRACVRSRCRASGRGLRRCRELATDDVADR